MTKKCNKFEALFTFADKKTKQKKLSATLPFTRELYNSTIESHNSWFCVFFMFQNHSNSSTLCFINILGSLRYCRFLVTWYWLYFIFRHSESISESNTEEMLKRVQHDHWVSRHSEFISKSNTEEMLK